MTPWHWGRPTKSTSPGIGFAIVGALPNFIAHLLIVQCYKNITRMQNQFVAHMVFQSLSHDAQPESVILALLSLAQPTQLHFFVAWLNVPSRDFW